MSLRTILIVTGALMCGIAAMVGVSMIPRGGGGGRPAEATTPVMVAIADVARGSTIAADQVEIRSYPKSLVPAGALTKATEAVDRVALGPLSKGELLLESKLSPKGAGRGLAAMIPKGKRAYTIATPDIASGVAGFILPGNRVDVLLAIKESGNDDATGGASSMVLLQNVEILAVDQEMNAPAENKVDSAQLRSVTLLVNPNEVTQLDLGQHKGTLHLSLRNPNDTASGEGKTATFAELRGQPAVVAAPPPPPEPEPEPKPAPTTPPTPRHLGTIRTLRGFDESEVSFYAPVPGKSAAQARAIIARTKLADRKAGSMAP